MKSIYFVMASAVLLLFIWHLTTAQVQAQAQIPWEQPIRLSTEGVDIDNEASMVADAYGYLHVFWPEENLEDGRSTIQYTRFDGKFWSEPLDIYLAPPRATIGVISPLVDQQGTLHLLWTEGNTGPIYYSTAPAYDALSAWAWTKPRRLDIPAYHFRFQIDAQDTLHIVYTDFYGSEPGVYYVQSIDYGLTWSAPLWLDPDIPPNEAPPLVQFALDQQGGLHALWYYKALEIPASPGTWIRYANSLDGGANWSFPFTIDSVEESEPDELRLPSPGMSVIGDTVHVIWAGTSNTNREHRFSSDRGLTWTETRRVFGDLGGQAIGDGLAVDGAGRLHFIGQIRWPQALYHIIWNGTQWLEPSIAYLIARNDGEGRQGRYHAHNVRAAIRADNQLVVTFTDEHTGPLYAMYRTLEDVPAAIPLSTPQPEPTVQLLEPELIFLPTPKPIASIDNIEQLSAAPGNQPSLATNLWWGVLPTLLLVLVITAVRLLFVRPR